MAPQRLPCSRPCMSVIATSTVSTAPSSTRAPRSANDSGGSGRLTEDGTEAGGPEPARTPRRNSGGPPLFNYGCDTSAPSTAGTPRSPACSRSADGPTREDQLRRAVVASVSGDVSDLDELFTRDGRPGSRPATTARSRAELGRRDRGASRLALRRRMTFGRVESNGSRGPARVGGLGVAHRAASAPRQRRGARGHGAAAARPCRHRGAVRGSADRLVAGPLGGLALAS